MVEEEEDEMSDFVIPYSPDAEDIPLITEDGYPCPEPGCGGRQAFIEFRYDPMGDSPNPDRLLGARFRMLAICLKCGETHGYRFGAYIRNVMAYEVDEDIRNIVNLKITSCLRRQAERMMKIADARCPIGDYGSPGRDSFGGPGT